jgi:putative ABC transport system permease protein
MRATFRWTRADLRGRRGQALLTVGVVAGVVAALVVAAMLLEGAVNPWKGLFARTRGADMMLYLSYDTPAGQPVQSSTLADLPDVRMVDTHPFSPATLERGSTEVGIQLTAMPVQLQRIPISAPLVVAGSWLIPRKPDDVVLEASFAASIGIRVGSQVTVQSADSRPVQLTVAGLADTTDQGFYPQATPGLVWAQLGALKQVQPNSPEWEEVADFRLADTSAIASEQVYQDAFDSPAYQTSTTAASVVQRFTTAQQVENSMASDDRLLGLLLGLFGIIALVAAPCAIANVTAGRLLMYRQDLAMLKALGFTPGQVVRMLLAEQTGLGVVGAVLGVALARVVTSPQFIHPPDGTPIGLAPFPGSWVTLIAAGTVATVAIATAIPAWWAGRVSPVAAVQASPPRGHLSLIARLGLLVHLPAALVLGARDSLTRRLPSLLTVFGLAIPLIMITVALSCWTTIDGFSGDPARIGLPAGLTVPASGMPGGHLLSLLKRVGTPYPDADLPPTSLPGDNGTFTALAIGTSHGPGRFPFVPVQGSMYDALNQAVAGQGFLDLMHLSVGDSCLVLVDGVPVDVHITGRILDGDYNGDVLAFGMDTLALASADSPQQPELYDVVLRPGLSPATARADLLRWSGDDLKVSLVANPADSLGIVRVVIAISVVVLAVIGLASLLTATAIGLRDHRHETGVLAALGLTPRQVMATLVVNTTILTAIGVSLGVAAGLVVAPRLINMQGQASGMGAGIATDPSVLTLAMVFVVALLVTTLAALLMARRTMRMADPAAQLRTPGRPARAFIS